MYDFLSNHLGISKIGVEKHGVANKLLLICVSLHFSFKTTMVSGDRSIKCFVLHELFRIFFCRDRCYLTKQSL